MPHTARPLPGPEPPIRAHFQQNLADIGEKSFQPGKFDLVHDSHCGIKSVLQKN